MVAVAALKRQARASRAARPEPQWPRGGAAPANWARGRGQKQRTSREGKQKHFSGRSAPLSVLWCAGISSPF